MGAEEGISLGVKVVICIGICTALLVVCSFGSKLVKSQLKNVTKINNTAKTSGFSRYDDTEIGGYDLWDAFREQSGQRISNQPVIIKIHTNTNSIEWRADQPIKDAISDDPDDPAISDDPADPAGPLYVSEDWKFKCQLIKDNSGNVYGIDATLIAE